jgi:Skp family chaperone for outer membrane proteins
MRHILIATAFVGSLLATSAMAADLTDKGAIKTMDAKKCTITLADNKVFQFADK